LYKEERNKLENKVYAEEERKKLRLKCIEKFVNTNPNINFDNRAYINDEV